MKKKFLKSVLFCLTIVTVFMLLLPQYMSVFSYEENDAWVLEYENMKEKTKPGYVVPTLFKNDRSFSNHHRFPLVVKDGVHYVPLEIFSGLSGIRITYGSSVSNFYITNNNNGKYISFDTDNNLVTTENKESYRLETKIFYSTRYLPAHHIVDALDIKMEIFSDKEKGIYAIRISDDKAKLDLEEVIKMYTPIKKEPVKEEPEVNEEVIEDKFEPEIVSPQVTPEIGNRNIYLSFNVNSYYYITEILQTLNKNNAKATFFVKPDDILSHSDEVRQIIAYEQNIGFLLDVENAKEELLKGNENLRLVSKRSSRLVRFDSGSVNVNMTNEEYSTFIQENGLCVWDWNIHSGDYLDMYNTIYNSLYNLRDVNRTTTAVIRILPGKNTASAISSLCKLVSAKQQLRFSINNEITSPLAYRKP